MPNYEQKTLLLNNLLKTIKTFSPESIILFGSGAKGFNDIHSDLDISIVFDDNELVDKSKQLIKKIKTKYPDAIFFKLVSKAKRFTYFGFLDEQEIDLIFSTKNEMSVKTKEFKILYSKNANLKEDMLNIYSKFKTIKQLEYNFNCLLFMFRNSIVALNRDRILKANFELDKIRYELMKNMLDKQGLVGVDYRQSHKVENIDNFTTTYPESITKEQIIISLNNTFEVFKLNFNLDKNLLNQIEKVLKQV